jgi:uncharacterized protein (TIGR00730 family)
MQFSKICVYCGSSAGGNPAYIQAAHALGEEIAKRNLTLVYGGGKVGLMGEVARSAMQSSGRVIGIIPKALRDQELAFNELTELHVVNSMHERKAMMAELADGFIALPGGYGTIDEFFEVLTWSQLGFHTKPCGILNINHYYDRLLEFLDQSVEEKFIYQPHRDLILQAATPAELLDAFSAYQPVRMNKAEWARKMESGK